MAGPFLKTSDGYTLATKCTLSTSKVKLSKNDAAFANKASTKGSSYSAHGQYRIFLTTADSGTLGRLRVSVLDTKCLPVWQDYQIVAANQYNSIMLDSDKLQVDVTQNNGAASTFVSTGDLDAAIVSRGSTFSSGQLTAALVSFVGTTEWNDAIGGLSTLSTADLDTAIDAAGLSTLSTGDLDDALTAYAPTTEAVSDITAAIFVTPANKLRTDTQGNVLLTTAARAEPGQGAPAVNADAMKKLDYLFKSWRNKKTQDATTWSLYNDAGAVVDQKATISDDGTTATIGEIGSGA
jgi:hypothetical protein